MGFDWFVESHLVSNHLSIDIDDSAYVVPNCKITSKHEVTQNNCVQKRA